MLDTLLHIGKILRESGRLRHHRYIKPAPRPTDKTEVVYYVLPVRNDFSLDINSLHKVEDEYLAEKLYYLTYKTSDSDTLMKYIWGDIAYGVDKKGKEQGNYRMENPNIKNAFGLSSFIRGADDAKAFNGTCIEKFRNSYEQNREKIEKLLQQEGQGKLCYLHFDFQGKHWYQYEDELRAVNEKLLQELIEEQNNSIVLRKSLYKTLASAEKNLPFPNFSAANIYKTRTFASRDEVMDLLYSINYSTKAIVSERDIKIIILPKGEKLKANHIEEFFERRGFVEVSKAEERIADQNIAEDELNLDTLFAPVVAKDIPEEIIEFDFVFSKAGGMTAPDVDMIELAGIKRSFLAELAERTNEIRMKIESERSKTLDKGNKLKPLSIKQSFLNILGDVTKEKKKYQSHLLKVLPQIYSGNYYKDDLLLPAFIEKTEHNIRQEKANFNLLKFDYEFLVRLRNNIGKNNIGEKEMDDMKNSKSYKAGKLLGQLAQPVSWEIKSFEKNYVGLLSRRISDLPRLIEFSNFINEKLAIHERAYQNLKAKFGELAAILAEMNQRDYHRDYCAFGFFEGYFSKSEKTEKEETNEGENQ